MAKGKRRLIKSADKRAIQEDVAPLWEISGVASDEGPLFDGIPVSERPEMYSHDNTLPQLETDRPDPQKQP